MSNDIPPYWFDGTHILIAGTTGAGERFGGKTATAHYWLTLAARDGPYDYGIAFDPKAGGYDFPAVSSASGAAERVAQGADMLLWEPDRRNMNTSHEAAMRFAKGLQGSVIMAHDDAVMYRDAESLAMATALAGNPSSGGGVKSVVVTQDPWDLPRQGVRANLPVKVWVGPVTDEADAWFQQVKTGSVGDTIRQRHEGSPHSFTVMNGDELHSYPPVPEGFA